MRRLISAPRHFRTSLFSVSSFPQNFPRFLKRALCTPLHPSTLSLCLFPRKNFFGIWDLSSALCFDWDDVWLAARSMPCPHGLPPSRCKECCGCEHGRLRGRCKECGGSSFCASTGGGAPSARSAAAAASASTGGNAASARSAAAKASASTGGCAAPASKESGGGSICEHGRVRYLCKECGGQCHLRARAAT